MKPREEETLLQDGSTETRDVELKHILFAHVNDHLLYGDDDISRFFCLYLCQQIIFSLN
jgi:hypothetical protein